MGLRVAYDIASAESAPADFRSFAWGFESQLNYLQRQLTTAHTVELTRDSVEELKAARKYPTAANYGLETLLPTT
jgi:hypothetical protein